MKMDDVIKDFSPAWFTIVMGTGSFANVLYLWGNKWIPGHNLGIILASLNVILFILSLFPWVARWFKHFDLLKKDLQHPITGKFFVTMPLGTMILGTNFALMGGNFFGKYLLDICFLAWIIGVVGALIFGIYGGQNLMHSENNLPEVINFAWLIPPVGSMAVPLIGSPLVKLLRVNHVSLAKDVFIVNLGFFGIGFFLFLFIGGIVFTRLAVHSLPTTSMTPTFWIPLGPVGVGVVALIGMADTAKAMGFLPSTDLIYLMAAVFWGLGLWFLGVALMITWHNFRKDGIPFTLSWWAFVFPLSAYTMASIKMARYFNSNLVLSYSVLLSIGLALAWSTTFILTAKGVFNGSLLSPHIHSITDKD